MTARNDIVAPEQDTVGDGEPVIADDVQVWRCPCCGDVTITMYRDGKPIAEAAFGCKEDALDFVADAMGAINTEATRQ